MTRCAAYLAWTAAAACACAGGIAQARAYIPTHDPFARPRASAPPHEQGMAPVQPDAQAPWKPELRAVMVAGAASMVDVGGTVLRIGEKMGGYRLVAVHEEGAVFEKGGKQYVVALDGSGTVTRGGRR